MIGSEQLQSASTPPQAAPLAPEEHLVWDGDSWCDVYESEWYVRFDQEDYADGINWGFPRKRSRAVEVPPWLTQEEAREVAIKSLQESTPRVRYSHYPRRPRRSVWGSPTTVTMLGYDIWIVDTDGHRELHMGTGAALPLNFPYNAFYGLYYYSKWAAGEELINLSLAFTFDLGDIESRLARYWPEMSGRDQAGVPHVVRRAVQICAEDDLYAPFAGDVADLLEVYTERSGSSLTDAEAHGGSSENHRGHRQQGASHGGMRGLVT